MNPFSLPPPPFIFTSSLHFVHFPISHINMPLISSTAIMALPAVKTLQDCADWSKTVEPFIPQLQAFPQQAAHHLASITDLRNLYASTNPLVSATAFSLFLSPLCLIVSEINRNYSQVDRLWSLLPALYNVHYAIWAHVNGLPTQRVDNIAIISVVWSVRRLAFGLHRNAGLIDFHRLDSHSTIGEKEGIRRAPRTTVGRFSRAGFLNGPSSSST